MAYKYENHGKIYKEEKDRADEFEKLYTEMKDPYDSLKREAHRLKLVLVKYEQKYGFIDIGKLHAKVESKHTLFEAAKKEAAGYHHDLLEIRKRLMEVTRRFDRGGFNADSPGRNKQKEEEPWKGEEDVEKLVGIFNQYITQNEGRLIRAGTFITRPPDEDPSP